LDPVTLRPRELSIILAKLADPIELKDDHEFWNRNVQKVMTPVDNNFMLSDHLEPAHGLHNPKQSGLSRIFTPRVSGPNDGMRSP